MRKTTLKKLHAAARFFASRDTCSAQDIADRLKIPLNSVYYFARQPEWHEALDALGFDGRRKFVRQQTREPQRDRADLVKKARRIYRRNRRDGKKHSIAVNAVLKNVPQIKDRRTINTWAKRYGWEAKL